MSKTVWITGGSSGIGKAAALLFLKNGYSVCVGARHTERMRDLAERGATVLKLDVTDQNSCEAFVRCACEATGGVDILVNNAGYGEYGPVEAVSEEKAKRELDTVVFGAIRMIKLCAPLMRRKKGGRIINMISAGGRVVTYLGGWYHASKYALEALTDSLRMELSSSHIDVIAIEPGGVRTGFGDQAAENLCSAVSATPYEKEGRAVAEVYRKVYGKDSRMLTSPEKAARVILKAAQAKRVRARYLFGFGSHSLVLLSAVLPQRAFDALMRGMYRSKFVKRLIK